MDLDSKVFAIGSAVGVILMLASLLSYISDPKDPLILLFVIGLVLMVAGYILTYRENHRLYEECEELQRSEDMDGFMISFDDDYVPYDNPATIEDLRD